MINWLQNFVSSNSVCNNTNWTPATWSSDFVNHSYDYKPNWTSLSPVTMIYSGTAVNLHNKYTLKEILILYILIGICIYKVLALSFVSFNGNLSLSSWAFSSMHTTILILKYPILHLM